MEALSAFLDALSFLTILPFSSKSLGVKPALRMSRALTWFPLVGAMIGVLGGTVAYLAVSWWPPSVAAILSVAAMGMVTGGLHLDGFSDTVDGLGSGKGREEILRIMQDSRIGAFGAMGLFLLLGLKWALIQAIPTHQWIRALSVSGCLSRWGLVISGQFFPYTRGREGLGRLVTDSKSPISVMLATVIALGILLAATGHWGGLLCIGLAGLVVWGLNVLFLLRLGGITGDTLGAVSEIVEVSVLLFLVMR